MPKGKTQEQQSKKKFSLFGRKKGNTPTVDPSKVDNKNVTPPSYVDIQSKYEKLETKANAMARSNRKSTKGSELEELLKQKGEADNEYTKASEFTDLTSAQENVKDDLKGQKENTDAAVKEAERKVSRDVRARQKLEQYKGKMIMKVIQHASKLKDEDDDLKEEKREEELAKKGAGNNGGKSLPNPATEEKKKNKERRAKIRKDREEKKSKFKKKDRLDKVFAETEIGRIVVLHGATIAGAISEGVTTFNSEFKDRKVIEKYSDYRWFDGFSDAASVMSIMSLIEAGASFTKACVEVHRRRKSGNVDKQEQFLDSRMILGKLAELFSIFWGAVTPYTALVPHLGSALGILDSLIQLIIGGINLGSNAYHCNQMRKEKNRIWEAIQQKRDKYNKKGDKESADFYNMDKDTTVSRRPWRKRWSKADSKRKSLQAMVAGWENAGKEPDEQKQDVMVGAHISTRISSLRERKHKGKLSEDEQKNYKKNIHAMEALQMLNQYRTAEKAEKKMDKAILADSEGIITNLVKIIANGLSFADATGAAGTIVNWAESGYEMARFGGSYIYKAIRKSYGSEDRKEATRKQMGAYLFDKMVALGREDWDGDFFNLNVDDYKIREYQRSMDELQTIREGMDLRVSDLLKAPTGKHMRKVLANSFSQDGGVEFGADAI